MTNSTGAISTQNVFSLTDSTFSLARLLLQVVVILLACRAISYPFRFLRQPRVIAEVIGGILLGPTALGRWTWFRSTIFPSASLPPLNLLANLGLVLFLLLMGLELDLSVVAKRARTSLTISFTGICLTFAISIGISRFFYLYIPGIADSVEYPKLLIFIGVAMSVTALPVLARILTERGLLRTPVGVTVISAAAVDDAVGWTALALVISLIAAASPLTGLYILLTVLAFAAFMFLAIRPLLSRIYQYLSSLHNQNANREHETLSQPMVIVAFVTCLIASFFTSAVGIHPIFGAFLTGLTLPRENGFAVKLSEKIEELVSVVLLPLYFTYSGLRTNIGAINSGVSGLSLVLVLLGCMTGKIGGCTLAARSCGLSWREAFAVGILMDTKGLVEIIILNIGLDSHLINDQVFAIMVLLAIITTCITTPAISVVYPESFYAPTITEKVTDDFTSPLQDHRRFLLCLPTSSSVPTMMSVVQLISGASSLRLPNGSPWVSLHAVRLRSLTDRMSALIMAASSEVSALTDPALNAFQMFSRLRGFSVKPHLVITEVREYAKEVAKLASETESDMIIVPWKVELESAKPKESDAESTTAASSKGSEPSRPAWFSDAFPSENPSEASKIAGKPGSTEQVEQLHREAAGLRTVVADLTTQLLRKARVKVAVLVDRSVNDSGPEVSLFAQTSGKDIHILVPFFGGPDDRAAILFAIRLSSLPQTIVTILHIRSLHRKPEAVTAQTNGRRRSVAPGVTRLRRRMFSRGQSKSQTLEDQPNLPDGYAVDPVDPEDSRILDMVLQHSGPVQEVPITEGPSGEEKVPAQAGPSEAAAPAAAGGLLLPPPGSIPFRRVATATSMTEDQDIDASAAATSDSIVPSNNLSPNAGSALRRPSVADLGGVPAVRLATATSQKTLESTTGSTGPTIEFNFPRPTINLTEVAAVDPLAALLQALESPESRSVSLVVLGHFGPSWHGSAANEGDHVATVLPGSKPGNFVDGHWHDNNMNTVTSMGGILRPSAHTGSTADAILGPTGSAILRAGGAGRANLMVVRKFRMDAKTKEI